MSFNRTNPDGSPHADLTSLKSEVDVDPENVGYAAVVAETAKLRALLNDPTNNPQVLDQVGIPFDEFPIIDVLDEIDSEEYGALVGVYKTFIDSVIQAGIARTDEESALGIAYFGPVKKLFKKAFNNLDPALIDPVPANNQSKTWLAIKDDRQIQASRAEALFGRGTIITREDWFAARDS